MRLKHPSVKYTSIQFNEGLRALDHVDGSNVGLSLILSLGPFFGGWTWTCNGDEIKILSDPGPELIDGNG